MQTGRSGPRPRGPGHQRPYPCGDADAHGGGSVDGKNCRSPAHCYDPASGLLRRLPIRRPDLPPHCAIRIRCAIERDQKICLEVCDGDGAARARRDDLLA
ncbi:MAG: hypothetical protein MZV70_18790 [Desulfobacterales bacterium]|nr:hypothetical protein [Desulfobacterales bacterium]